MGNSVDSAMKLVSLVLGLIYSNLNDDKFTEYTLGNYSVKSF